MMRDFDNLDIKLIDGATIETIKRLLAGLDVDDCAPCVRAANGETMLVQRIEIEGNRLIFVAY
jgi:hypothetical protein